ncbi:MAG: hypothetical protein Q4D98_04415 [Planctomycetia bacterium]|nr:hypothetical protein [Planctomycetia bacterium]
MIKIKLRYGRLNLATGFVEYDSPDGWRKDRDAYLAGEKPEIFSFYDDGKVEINGQTLPLTPTQRTILFCLRSGECSRLDVMNEVIPESRQLTMKDPEGAMRQSISRLNTQLENYGFYVELTPTHYLLKSFKKVKRTAETVAAMD